MGKANPDSGVQKSRGANWHLIPMKLLYSRCFAPPGSVPVALMGLLSPVPAGTSPRMLHGSNWDAWPGNGNLDAALRYACRARAASILFLFVLLESCEK